MVSQYLVYEFYAQSIQGERAIGMRLGEISIQKNWLKVFREDHFFLIEPYPRIYIRKSPKCAQFFLVFSLSSESGEFSKSQVFLQSLFKNNWINFKYSGTFVSWARRSPTKCHNNSRRVAWHFAWRGVYFATVCPIVCRAVDSLTRGEKKKKKKS